MQATKFKKAASSIVDLAEDLVFIPSPAQRKAKAKFWMAVKDNPSVDPNNISASQAESIINNQSVRKWWAQPGFKEWFKGKEEFRERLEYLCQVGLDTAEEILLIDDPKAVNAKVSLIKVLLEAGGKIDKGKQIKLLDESVQKMSKAQLEEYMKKQGLLKEST